MGEKGFQKMLPVTCEMHLKRCQVAGRQPGREETLWTEKHHVQRPTERAWWVTGRRASGQRGQQRPGHRRPCFVYQVVGLSSYR